MKLVLATLLVVAAAAACDDDTTNCHEDPCEPGHEEGGAGGTSGEGASDAVRGYCDCMLTSCHDTYHAHYGPESDETAARAACVDEAAALTETALSCRQDACTEGATDETACPNTIGGTCE